LETKDMWQLIDGTSFKNLLLATLLYVHGLSYRCFSHVKLHTARYELLQTQHQ
jgi:hypothetical protein